MQPYKLTDWESIEGPELTQDELDRAFFSVMTKAGQMEKPANGKQRLGIPGRVYLYAAAALAIILAPILSLNYVKKHSVPQTVANIEVSTGKGEIREVVLPDKSRVVLNANSMLVFPEVFACNRSVFLSGEAIFDVTSTPEDPFYVNTSDVCIRVYGTKFNVRSYFDDEDVRTTLCRGALEVWPKDRRQLSVDIIPGESVCYERSGGTLTVSRVNALEAVSWENGNLCFRSESIHGIIRVLERKYDIDIYLSTDRFNNAVISANFIHKETLEDLLDAICAVVPGMKYTIDGKSVTLK